MRGVYEKKIDQEAFNEAMPRGGQESAELAEDFDPDTMQPQEPQVTDEEVRQMLVRLKKLADDAEIPDEPFQIDVGDEVKKVVDKALADKNVP
jgi:hypothetical protein